MNLSERIQAILDDTKAEQVELAAAAGVSKGTVNQWLSGDIKSIKLEYAVGIQERYGYNAVWIVMDKEPKKVPGIHHEDPFEPIPIKNWKAIPMVGMAQLGDNGHWADLEYPVGHGDGYVDFPTLDPNAYALKCEGDSMKPRIQAGEFVVVEPSQPVEPGDDVLLKAKDGRVMVKRFLYRRAGRTHLISVNDAHPPMAFSDDEIEKMHFVRAICRPSAWRPE
jgi:phage repressor protein C with HTH and peptisase S24 domain